MHNDVLNDFNCIISDDSKDGVLWLCFTDKCIVDFKFYVCVVYLQPENSAR